MIIDPQLGVLLPPSDKSARPSRVYEQARIRETDQEGAEANRLLYVAATRARERLIFSGCARLKKDGTPGWLGNSWLGKLAGPAALDFGRLNIPHNEDGDQAIRLELKLPGGIPVACTVYEPNYRPPAAVSLESESSAHVSPTLPPSLLSPILPEPVIADARTADLDRLPQQRVWRIVPAVAHPSAPAWVVGKLVHEALATWRFPDADHRFERWTEAQARSHGLTDPRQIADAGRETRRLLLRFREHPLYAEMAAAEWRRHEVPYSRIDADDHVESGIIDALYLRGGVWTIVEFKTDKVHEPGKIDALLEQADYVPQAERYQVAVERLVGWRPQLVFCFLDCGGAVHTHRRI